MDFLSHIDMILLFVENKKKNTSTFQKLYVQKGIYFFKHVPV